MIHDSSWPSGSSILTIKYIGQLYLPISGNFQGVYIICISFEDKGSQPLVFLFQKTKQQKTLLKYKSI